MRRGGRPPAWLRVRNRDEEIDTDGRGVRCRWVFTSDLHLAKVFPSTGSRLLRRALAEWPMALAAQPGGGREEPLVSFVVGHRGMERLPQLLLTLRSIAAQSIPIECIVVEQSAVREVESRLPPWVRYAHTSTSLPYCRSWAFNVGARIARGGVLILHDNDMIVPAQYAAEARQRVSEGWGFADLKRFIFYLSEKDTGRVLAGAALPGIVPETIVQNAQGGSIAADREAYFAIGGFDESFIGWGGEDNDFRERAEALGRVYDFGYLPFLHLHHPAQSGKLERDTPAIERYRSLDGVPPRERIARLLQRQQGRIEEPAVE